jgi:predicted dehydrogenase
MSDKRKTENSRRNFIKNFSFLGLGTAAIGSGLTILNSCRPQASTQAAGVPEDRQIGIALVGLGWYSTDQLGPALMETKYCRLAGVVTGTPEKGTRFQKKYGFPKENIYNYDNFEDIANNPDIDVIYLALPPVLHPEFAIRAFKAGKHVICEKPMAPTAREAEEMIRERDTAGKLMSIGYRVHFDPYHREAMRLGQEKVFGAVTKMENEFAMYWDRGGWRTKKDLGGGSVWDLGTYVTQASIYTIGENPIAVTAKEKEKDEPEKFGEVDEGMEFTLEFPGGATAECKTGFWSESDKLRAETEKGWFEIEPAFDYYGQRGETGEGVIHFGQVNQQAFQMDDFALRVINNDQNTPVPAEMGLRDVRIIEAVYQSAQTGQRVELNLDFPPVTAGKPRFPEN